MAFREGSLLQNDGPSSVSIDLGMSGDDMGFLGMEVTTLLLKPEIGPPIISVRSWVSWQAG